MNIRGAGSTAIVVLGMHRSGTSALAGVLNQLGAEAGTSLVPAQAHVNPKGFWEHAKVVSLHDELLGALGSSWNDCRPLADQWWRTSTAVACRLALMEELRGEFASSPLWLIKDPRMCRLLPLWLDVFAALDSKPCFVLCLRHPAEVAGSLKKRDGMSEPESCLLWLAHMLDAERLTRGQPRIHVPYDSLLADWRRIAVQIEQTFSLKWPVPVEQAASAVEKFLDPSLDHHVGRSQLPDHPACRMAEEAYQAFMGATDPGPVLDRLQRQMTDLEVLVAPWSRQLPNLRNELVLLRSENTQLRAEVIRIKRTVSWRITGPMRALWNLFCRD